jgi:hypothetical protein
VLIVHRAILHTPFVPFITLFNKCIKFSDEAELSRLERFANSLILDSTISESSGRPLRLYQLLCQVARLHIDSNIASNDGPGQVSSDLSMDTFELGSFGAGADFMGLHTGSDYHYQQSMDGWWNAQNFVHGDGL